MKTGRKWIIMLFLLPALLLYIINVIIPIIQSSYYSLLSWDGISHAKFIGLQNYIDLIKDPVFYQSSRNMLYFVIGAGGVQVFIGLLLAAILRGSIKGLRFFRTVLFFPVVISAVSIAMMFSMIYQNEMGLLNTFLRNVGLGALARPWLGDQKTAIFAAIFPEIWQYIGFIMVIMLAALMNIPSDILEYAELDGLSGVRKVINIYIPLTWEVIQVCIVLGVTGALKSFEHIYVLTTGGPIHASEIWGTYMYKTVFKSMQFGYGSTISIIILMAGFLFTIILKKYFSRDIVQY